MRSKDLGKQQRIKEAMVHLILREGIDGASIAKIAKEAGVSPATIYVYYENKEDMLSEVFREYSRNSYRYLMKQVHPEMSGEQLIRAIVKGAYAYALENEEIFSFVEQCSRNPALQECVCESDCCLDIFELLHRYQEHGIMRRYSDQNLAAILFPPVRFLVMNYRNSETQDQLDELIAMLQRMLLY